MSVGESETKLEDDDGGGAILYIIAAVFVVASALMFFRHPDNNWPSPDKVVTIFVPNDPSLRQALEIVKTRFEKRYEKEGYRIRMVWGTWSGYGQKIQFNEVAKIQTDIIYMDQKDFPLLTAKGILEDLTPLLGNELDIDIQKFYAPALEQLRFNGKLYALPYLFSPTQVYYNKTLFRKNGIPLPKDDPKDSWTYREFLTAARKLTQDIDGDGKLDQYGVGGLERAFPGFIWREGGRIFSEDMKTCLIDSPKAIRGLSRMYELYQTYRVVPPKSGLDEMKRFSAGKLAMYFGARFSMKKFVKIKDFKWGIAPMPRSDTTGLTTTTIIVDSFALAKHGANRKLGYLLLKFLTSDEMMREFAKTGSALPGVESIARSSIRDDITGDHLFLDVPADSRYFYRPPTANKEVHVALLDKLTLIWNTQARTPEAGAKEAAALIRLGFKRHARRAKQFGRSE